MMRETNEPSPAVREAKTLVTALSDLHVQHPLRGTAKTLVALVALFATTLFALTRDGGTAYVVWCVIASVVYSAVFVLTHDAIHHTLSGYPLFDEIAARLISYPALWFHALYKELHVLHHKMNGNDLHDPERPWWTEREYREASPLKRWYIRHQWPVDMFLLGGFGFIGHHVAEGLKHYRGSRAIRRALWSDVAGLFVVNGVIYGTAYYFGAVGKWVGFYLIAERVVGMIHQMRSRIEHYGLWGKEEVPLATQLHNSRNIRTGKLASFYFNGLNFHSVHHAFPRIPYYHLEEAHRRLLALVGRESGKPLAEDDGYLRTMWRLVRNPVVIRDADPKTSVPVRSIAV